MLGHAGTRGGSGLFQRMVSARSPHPRGHVERRSLILHNRDVSKREMSSCSIQGPTTMTLVGSTNRQDSESKTTI